MNPTGRWMTPPALESLRQDVMRRGMELVPFYEAAGQHATADHVRVTCRLLAWAPDEAVRIEVARLGAAYARAAALLPAHGQRGWSLTLQCLHTLAARHAVVA